jgi:hypothetical protein
MKKMKRFRTKLCGITKRRCLHHILVLSHLLQAFIGHIGVLFLLNG